MRKSVIKHYKWRIEIDGLGLSGLTSYLKQGKITHEEFTYLSSICIPSESEEGMTVNLKLDNFY